MAIIAHYHTVKNAVPKEKIEELIKDKRLDGIETVFGLWSYGTSEEPLIKEYRAFAESIVQRHACLSSGGADVHKEVDLKDFSEKAWYSRPTIGMAQKMIISKRANPEWSSLTP